jgi:hypothetical protein
MGKNEGELHDGQFVVYQDSIADASSCQQSSFFVPRWLILEECSVLIVQSRALRVQGEGRFLALGGLWFWERKRTCIVKYKVEWRITWDSAGLLYTRGRQVSHERKARVKGKARALWGEKRVYMAILHGQTVQTGQRVTYISWSGRVGASK